MHATTRDSPRDVAVTRVVDGKPEPEQKRGPVGAPHDHLRQRELVQASLIACPGRRG